MAAAKQSEFNHKDGVSLKEYFDTRIKALEDKLELQFRLNQEAIDKADKTMNIRLESMNEFRAQIKDETATFAKKSEVENLRKFNDDKLRTLELSKASLDGKANQSTVSRGLVFSLIGSLLGVAALILNILR